MTDQEFKETFQIHLNPQQEAAVLQTEGPVLLLAVPGSGKTTVLVTRLGYLLYCKGVSPDRLLTVTYTVAAAGEMKRRFAAKFGEEHAGRLAFRTINGLCATVVNTYARWKGTTPFALANDEGKLNNLLRELLQRTGTDWPSEQQIKDARTHITYCKNQMLTEAEIHAYRVEGMDFPAIYFEYQDYLRRSKHMDFDDQMVFTYRIFRQYPEILAHFQDRWPYLCVDEAQDTSKIQHVILQLLAQKSRNLFLVGDEDQSIYGFRAAFPQALLDFESAWPGAHVLLMETNYRSTGAIVERADAFIQRNQDRHPKHMETHNPQGAPVRKVTLADYSRQYRYLARVARDCQRPTAVLYRNNDSALPLIDLLEREKIPYSCRQREGFFFTSPIVRDLTDILAFAYDPTDRERFLRFYYKLDLKVKKTVVTQALRVHGEGEPVLDALLAGAALEPWQMGRAKALRTHFSKLPQLTAFAALQRIVKYMGYGDYLKEQRMDTAKLDILLALAQQAKEPADLLERLGELRELLGEGSAPADSPFVLSTIHASKGLEYDRVILMDVMDGVFPNVSGPEDRAALEEERRLFYVGVTRAREQLDVLTYEAKFGEPEGAVSTFVTQFFGEEKPPLGVPAAGGEPDYPPGTQVVHKVFGPGILQSQAGSIAVIAFQSRGVKKVDLTACLRKGLLWKK